MKFTKTHETIFIILVVIAAFIFWDSLFLYPVKLISVIFHEFSHVAASLITGGTVNKVEITSNLGGITNCINSNEIAVLISGYIGSLILGIVVFLTTKNAKAPLFILPLTAIIYFVFGIFFIKNNFGIIFSIIIALFFLVLLFIKNKSAVTLILKILSLLCISYVINDVIHDTFLTTNLYSDAVRLEQITGINDWIWGASWLALSAIALTVIIWKMFKISK